MFKRLKIPIVYSAPQVFNLSDSLNTYQSIDLNQELVSKLLQFS